MAKSTKKAATFISPNEAHLYWQSHVTADMIQRNRAKNRGPSPGNASRSYNVSPLCQAFADQSHSLYMGQQSPENKPSQALSRISNGVEFYRKKDNQPLHIPNPTIPQYEEHAFLNQFANRLATKPNSQYVRTVEEEHDFIRTKPGWTNSVRQRALQRLIFDTGKDWTKNKTSKDF